MKRLSPVKLSAGSPELLLGEFGPVQGPLSDPSRKFAGQPVFLCMTVTVTIDWH